MKRGISQKKVAHKSGITQGYISLIEKNKKEPGFDLIDKIANTLDIPPQLIFLMAYSQSNKSGRFKKPLRNIALAADEILRAI